MRGARSSLAVENRRGRCAVIWEIEAIYSEIHEKIAQVFLEISTMETTDTGFLHGLLRRLQESMSGQEQFHVLHQHFGEVGPASKALLLSTYAKLANLYPECRELVTPVIEYTLFPILMFGFVLNVQFSLGSCSFA